MSNDGRNLDSFRADEYISHEYGSQPDFDTAQDELLLPILSELIDERDGHLGYTQIVRLFEVIRFWFWQKNVMSALGLKNEFEPALRAMQCEFVRAINGGDRLSGSATIRRYGTTSLELLLILKIEQTGEAVATCKQILVFPKSPNSILAIREVLK